MELGSFVVNLRKGKLNEAPFVEDLGSAVLHIAEGEDVYKIYITDYKCKWSHADVSIQRCLDFANHIIAHEIERNHGLDAVTWLTEKSDDNEKEN